jgi:hypothetical protein
MKGLQLGIGKIRRWWVVGEGAEAGGWEGGGAGKTVVGFGSF